MAILTYGPGVHRLKIESMDIGHARVSIDDTVVRASKVDVHMEVDSMHQAEITLLGEPEMDIDSLITFDFSPKTVRRAVDVLKVALKRKDVIARLGLEELNNLER
jgi:hypothetical protein